MSSGVYPVVTCPTYAIATESQYRFHAPRCETTRARRSVASARRARVAGAPTRSRAPLAQRALRPASAASPRRSAPGAADGLRLSAIGYRLVLKLQYLGDSRDAFKWDLLHWLCTRAEPAFARLLFVPLLTADG